MYRKTQYATVKFLPICIYFYFKALQLATFPQSTIVSHHRLTLYHKD